MNLLFICSRNQLRSPTAQAVLAGVEGVNALSAGTNHDAETPLKGDLIEWADEIIVWSGYITRNCKAPSPQC